MDYYKNLDLADIRYFNDEGVLCVEKWKDIPMFEGYYQASDLGRIKSMARLIFRRNNVNPVSRQAMIMKHKIEKKSKYHRVSLKDKEHMGHCLAVHRLVAQTFIPNPLNLPDVNHMKGVKSDNRVTRLEWMTKDDNLKHAIENDLRPIGEAHGQAKLSEKDILEIRKINKDYKNTEIAKMYGVSKTTIGRIVNNIRWQHI